MFPRSPAWRSSSKGDPWSFFNGLKWGPEFWIGITWETWTQLLPDKVYDYVTKSNSLHKFGWNRTNSDKPNTWKSSNGQSNEVQIDTNGTVPWPKKKQTKISCDWKPLIPWHCELIAILSKIKQCIHPIPLQLTRAVERTVAGSWSIPFSRFVRAVRNKNKIPFPPMNNE